MALTTLCARIRRTDFEGAGQRAASGPPRQRAGRETELGALPKVAKNRGAGTQVAQAPPLSVKAPGAPAEVPLAWKPKLAVPPGGRFALWPAFDAVTSVRTG
ncbi:hypothetical protein SGLAM104S_08142 [Streptomyces glaucescens]